eukprot:GHVR01147592.1.p1 GENE.GHVR01147592.1~~GHVR01147592.1.p1  ORF type:complete len:102 (+),score=7.41 GHVR01147592.1:1161-1466(+)
MVHTSELKMEFSMNHMTLTNIVALTSKMYLRTILVLLLSCSPNIYMVLMAKNVPAEIDKNMAYTTGPVDEIIHPAPIAAIFKIACPIIKQYATLLGTFFFL